jgi:RNA polymerase sigma-70 factor (ECF subfamily)
MTTALPKDADDFLPTRKSLLDRLKNLEDQTSWNEFFETYWKLMYSVARRTGLSDAEAQDVVQETVISVSRSIEGFNYDPDYGSFKAWLKRLTQWRVCDFVRKKQYQVNGKRFPKEEPLPTSLAEAQESPVWAQMEQAWEEEWKQHQTDFALQRVRRQADARQYQMFYFHVCKGFPVKQVAEQLNAAPAEVYAAKYRISALLKKEILALENEHP